MTKGAPVPTAASRRAARERPVGSFATSVLPARARGHARRGPPARAMSARLRRLRLPSDDERRLRRSTAARGGAYGYGTYSGNYAWDDDYSYAYAHLGWADDYYNDSLHGARLLHDDAFGARRVDDDDDAAPAHAKGGHMEACNGADGNYGEFTNLTVAQAMARRAARRTTSADARALGARRQPHVQARRTHLRLRRQRRATTRSTRKRPWLAGSAADGAPRHRTPPAAFGAHASGGGGGARRRRRRRGRRSTTTTTVDQAAAATVPRDDRRLAGGARRRGRRRLLTKPRTIPYKARAAVTGARVAAAPRR